MGGSEKCRRAKVREALFIQTEMTCVTDRGGWTKDCVLRDRLLIACYCSFSAQSRTASACDWNWWQRRNRHALPVHIGRCWPLCAWLVGPQKLIINLRNFSAIQRLWRSCVALRGFALAHRCRSLTHCTWGIAIKRACGSGLHALLGGTTDKHPSPRNDLRQVGRAEPHQQTSNQQQASPSHLRKLSPLSRGQVLILILVLWFSFRMRILLMHRFMFLYCCGVDYITLSLLM